MISNYQRCYIVIYIFSIDFIRNSTIVQRRIPWSFPAAFTPKCAAPKQPVLQLVVKQLPVVTHVRAPAARLVSGQGQAEGEVRGVVAPDEGGGDVVEETACVTVVTGVWQVLARNDDDVCVASFKLHKNFVHFQTVVLNVAVRQNNNKVLAFFHDVTQILLPLIGPKLGRVVDGTLKLSLQIPLNLVKSKIAIHSIIS